MEDEKDYTVGEVADMFGVSVRLLHHWDELGVAPASWRSWAGYRLYSGQDLERLQQALVYRETGMPLAQIRDVLDQGDDPVSHLRSQWDRLHRQAQQVARRIAAVEQLLENHMNHKPMTPQEKAQILGTDWDPAWEEEAKQSWGDTPEWAQSQQRLSTLLPEQFRSRVNALKELEERIATAMVSGVAPDSEEARSLVVEHRQVLSAVSFDVSPAQHFIISRSYVSDARFRGHYESRAGGLAQWLADAIEASARAEGVDVANPQWA